MKGEGRIEPVGRKRGEDESEMTAKGRGERERGERKRQERGLRVYSRLDLPVLGCVQSGIAKPSG